MKKKAQVTVDEDTATDMAVGSINFGHLKEDVAVMIKEPDPVDTIGAEFIEAFARALVKIHQDTGLRPEDIALAIIPTHVADKQVLAFQVDTQTLRERLQERK